MIWWKNCGYVFQFTRKKKICRDTLGGFRPVPVWKNLSQRRLPTGNAVPRDTA